MKRRTIRSGLNRHFVSLVARVAILSLLMQLAAFDHWGAASHSDIVGVAGSDAHELHCHGGPAGCSTSQTSLAVAQQPSTRVLIVAEWQFFAAEAEDLAPEGIGVSPLEQPPRLSMTATV